MKKILICFILTFTLLFSGCSCSKLSTLSFDTSWLNMNTSETKNYTVSLRDYDDGTYTYKYSADSKNIYGDISITGNYITKVEAVNIDDISNLVDSDFKQSISQKNSIIYKVSSTLDLDVVYNTISSDVNKDSIITTSYFYSNNLLPIYSKTESTTTYLGKSSNGLATSRIHCVDEIKYSIKEYTVNRTVNVVDNEATNETKTYEYEQGKMIDNGYLLFALENLTISEKDQTTSLPVISSVYGEYKTLTVKYFEDKNSETKYESFYLTNDSNSCFGGNTGRAQVIQLKNSNNKNTIIEYASPLCSYDSSYSCFGALVFTLQENN